MSDKMRWRYGDTNQVVAAVDADTVIEIGDLLWQATDDARPASSLDAKPYAQAVFKAFFLGVAMQRSVKGCTAPIRVATTGVFEFDADDAFELGDYVTPAGEWCLANQAVLKTPFRSNAIGRCAKRSARTTTVLVDIRSTIMTGGV